MSATLQSLTEQEEQLLNQVNIWAKQHQEELVADLQQLIRIPSISRADLGKEGAPFGPECAKVLDIMLDKAKQFGFATENHQGYAGTVVLGDFKDDIGLASHLDVVPEGDNWIFPPFDATRKDDFIIGRGASDNKGPAILDLYLLRLFKELKIPLKHNLRIIYGLAEETNMADLTWYAQNGPVPLVSLVTDGKFPTNHAQKGQIVLQFSIPVGPQLALFDAGIASNSVPAIAHIVFKNSDIKSIQHRISSLSGLSKDRITVIQKNNDVVLEAKGIAGHAAFPEGTLSAVRVLFSGLLEANLLEGRDKDIAAFFEQALQSPYGDKISIGFEDDVSGKLTFNAGVWRASDDGKTLNVTIDIRYPVKESGEHIIATLKNHLAEQGITLVAQRDVKPFYLAADDPRVDILQSSFKDVTGSDAPPYSMGGTTHSKVLPCGITFGPGFPRTAENMPEFLPKGHGFPHGADESVHIPTLLSIFPIYTLALIRLDRWLSEQNT